MFINDEWELVFWNTLNTSLLCDPFTIYFKLFIDSLWSSHHTPQSHSSLHPSKSALHPCNLAPIRKQTNKILLGKLWCVTQWTLLPKQLYLQMLIAVGHWAGSRSLLLLHYQHWVLPAVLLLLPMPWRSYCFGSAGPTLSRSPVDAGVGQVTALDVGLGDSWVSHSCCSLYPRH